MEIVVKNLTKKFKDIMILDNINIEFDKGKIYGLVGKNGSGKTVLLKMLAGIYVPTEGTIICKGEDFNVTKSFPKSVRALIENPTFIPDFTGLENLRMLAKIQNKIGDKEILKTLEDVNLIEEKDKPFSKYSLGMKQKLGIAQVLMEDPDIILLDEPFSAIEDESVLKIRRILLEKKKEGKLILISTHIKEDIDKLADEIYKFENAKVVKIENKNDKEA